LRQARHALKLQDEPQRDYRIVDVTAAGCLGKLIGHVAPSVALSC
jgi:hypothetical protein